VPVRLVRRGPETAASILVVAFLSFALVGLMPGDPIEPMLQADPCPTGADAARLPALHGLDRRPFQRFLARLGVALRGESGCSHLRGPPVSDLLAPRLAVTPTLAGMDILLAPASALPLEAIAALCPDGLADRLVDLVAFVAVSTPSLGQALPAILLFAVERSWLPAGGAPAAGAGPASRVRHSPLPVATLALPALGPLLRFVRTGLPGGCASLPSEPRAKVGGRLRVVPRHALPQALPSLVTVVALQTERLHEGRSWSRPCSPRLGRAGRSTRRSPARTALGRWWRS
jgi:peptide/nickel transport system permease protein